MIGRLVVANNFFFTFGCAWTTFYDDVLKQLSILSSRLNSSLFLAMLELSCVNDNSNHV